MLEEANKNLREKLDVSVKGKKEADGLVNELTQVTSCHLRNSYDWLGDKIYISQ